MPCPKCQAPYPVVRSRRGKEPSASSQSFAMRAECKRRTKSARGAVGTRDRKVDDAMNFEKAFPLPDGLHAPGIRGASQDGDQWRDHGRPPVHVVRFGRWPVVEEDARERERSAWDEHPGRVVGAREASSSRASAPRPIRSAARNIARGCSSTTRTSARRSGRISARR